MDGFSTHLPILKMVIELLKPQRVLELGVGEYSTPHLLGHASEVTSVETSSRE